MKFFVGLNAWVIPLAAIASFIFSLSDARRSPWKSRRWASSSEYGWSS